jgi:hypothetical protein
VILLKNSPIRFPVAEYRAKLAGEIHQPSVDCPAPEVSLVCEDCGKHAQETCDHPGLCLLHRAWAINQQIEANSRQAAELARQLAEPAEVPAQAGDRRGLGGIDQSGKYVRKYTGSSRPPHIDPSVWSKWFNKKEKAIAIAEYEASLGNPGAAAPSGTVRRIIELCCEQDSMIGNNVFCKDGCEVIRITKEDNLLTEAGFNKANEAAKHPGVLLVISLPCTGECAWQTVNITKPSARPEIHKKRRHFKRLCKKAIGVARTVRLHGGTVMMELPRNNGYWKYDVVVDFQT